jgi:hypothetical protein
MYSTPADGGTPAMLPRGMWIGIAVVVRLLLQLMVRCAVRRS